MTLPVLGGDGIGPAVVEAAVQVLRAAGWTEEVEHLPFGLEAWRSGGEALPERTVAAIRARGLALLGAGTSAPDGPPSPVLALRRALGLELLVRPVRAARLDVIIVGHALAGEYGAAEEVGPPALLRREVYAHQVDAVVAEGVRQARRRLTVVDKPTVFRATARLFEQAVARHAPPWLPVELVNADRLVHDLVRRPGDHDVLVGLSFMSDLLSDLAAGLGHGIGSTPSASLGAGVAVFEPVHGSAPRRADERPLRVDPTGAVLAAAMLARQAGEPQVAARIEAAVDAVRAARGEDFLHGREVPTAERVAAIVEGVAGGRLRGLTNTDSGPQTG